MSRKWFTLFIVTRMFTTNAFVLLRIWWWLVWRWTLAFIAYNIECYICFYYKLMRFLFRLFSPPFALFIRIVSLGYVFRNLSTKFIAQNAYALFFCSFSVINFTGDRQWRENKESKKEPKLQLKWLQNTFWITKEIFDSIWFHVISRCKVN